MISGSWCSAPPRRRTQTHSASLWWEGVGDGQPAVTLKTSGPPERVVTQSCRNSPKSVTTSALTPVLTKPTSRSKMPRSATGWGHQRLSLKMPPRLEGRHRARDHIKAGFILCRCPRAAAGNHWGLPPRFRVRCGCHGAAARCRPISFRRPVR
jgi:hypothetical protein